MPLKLVLWLWLLLVPAFAAPSRILLLVDDPSLSVTYEEITVLRQRAEALGYVVEIRAHGGSLKNESRLVVAAIAEKVRGIVVMPVDAEKSVPALQTARAAGMQVITLGRPLQDGVAGAQFVLDDQSCAIEAATLFSRLLQGKGKILQINGPSGDGISAARAAAYAEVLRRNPGLRNVGTLISPWRRETVFAIVRGLMASGVSFDGVLTSSDEQALGVLLAIQGQPSFARTVIGGFDGQDEAIRAVQENRLAYTMLQPASAMAEAAMTELDRLMQGGPALRRETRAFSCASLPSEQSTTILTAIPYN
jgi:erythritol transport system substrate-binding protein